MQEDALIGIAIVGLIVIGIVAKPGIALILCGLITALGGILTLGAGAFGIPFAAGGVIAGISLIGFGRLIMLVESLRDETRGIKLEARASRNTVGEEEAPELRRANEERWPR